MIRFDLIGFILQHSNDAFMRVVPPRTIIAA